MDKSASYTEPAEGRPGHLQEDELILVRFWRVLRSRWRLIGATAAFFGVAVVLITLLLPRTWTIRASFLPVSGQSQASSLAGLAAQFGVQVPGKDAGDSPALFTELLGSRDVLVRIIDMVYAAGPDQDRRSLSEWLNARGGSDGERREDALDRLRKHLGFRVSRETGIVSIAIEMDEPEVAKQVADRLLHLVEEFNVRRRQVLAAAEERFVGDRLQRAEAELMEAEENLERFLVRNRSYQNSPQLSLEWERLQRKVQTRQEVFTVLVQAYEQARIDAVRNTPVIAIIDQPTIPGLPDRRRLGMKAVAGVLLGGFLGLCLALCGQLIARLRGPLQASSTPNSQ